MANFEPWPQHAGCRAIKIVQINATFGDFLLANGELYSATGLMLDKAQVGDYLVDDNFGVRVMTLDELKAHVEANEARSKALLG